MYCGDSLGGTAPFTVDVTGPVYQGAFNFSVSYTGTVGDTDNGWNLLANPYPSAIDWEDASWSRGNVDDAIYMWNAEQNQYATYVGGVGINDGSNIIPQGHGFYVKASNTPASLSVSEQAKIDTTIAFLRPRRNEDLLIRLRINQSRFKDETIIRSTSEASLQFDPSLDAHHFAANGKNPLQLFTRIEGDNFAIDALDLSKVDTLPIFLTGKEGNALLHVSIENQHSTTCLYLWDRMDNHLFKLGDQDVIEFEVEDESAYHKYSLITRYNQDDCDNLLGDSPLAVKPSDRWAYYNGVDIIFTDESLENEHYKIYNLHGQLVSHGSVSSQTLACKLLGSGLYILHVEDRLLKFVNP